MKGLAKRFTQHIKGKNALEEKSDLAESELEPPTDPSPPTINRPYVTAAAVEIPDTRPTARITIEEESDYNWGDAPQLDSESGRSLVSQTRESSKVLSSPERENYYHGSKELATETPLTVTRLEPRRKLTKDSDRLVIALVGLPARGKSFVARKLETYFRWTGAYCEIFNVGRYRRRAYGESLQKKRPELSERDQKGACDADFFDPQNQETSQLREQVAEFALKDMLRWLDADDDYELDDDDDINHSTSSGFCSRQSSSVSVSSETPRLTHQQHGRVAIFDATNSTNKRRQWILEECTSPEKRGDKQTGVVFVESICDDQELLEENYRYKVSNSPDFEGMSPEEALEDLRRRVTKYEQQYETIQDDSLSYIKVFNLSTKLLVNHIYGRMAKDLVPALMAWHIGTRPVYLCRPGETISGILTDGEDYVARHSIDPSDPRFLDMSTRTKRRSMRGDSLGPNGKKFRQTLFQFCYKEVKEFITKRSSVHDMAFTGTSISGLAPRQTVPSRGNSAYRGEPFPIRILTSTMPRAVDTVTWEEYELPITQMSNLNPLDKGDFAGMEMEEIKRCNRNWFEKLERDPFGTRFPGGEGYRDLIRRLTPVVIDVEQQVSPILVVSHVSILQCLMAYFRNTPVERCMSIEVPMHTVIKYTPVRGGAWSETIIPLFESGTMDTARANESGELTRSSSPVAGPIWSDHLTAYSN